MRHKPAILSFKSKQSGSMLVTGLFIIVFMAVLLAGILRTINVGGINTAYEVVGTRALLAAQTGLEVGLSRLYPLNSQNSATCTAVKASPNPISLPNINAFKSCSVTLNCETRVDVNNNKDLFVITAKSKCNHSELSTSRKLEIEAIEL
ncbi:hypothetical protein [Catenovulum adriaticum]|uniref:MSHA biogenesis protein MshP n=1 Tax=Catenovulum adriaticum TaxID=2984846 RepID=A0ABY7ALD7_9ALTE|nr:hypothetical protein [Catenovulum sp. TS8]WAJ70067.1 hypothetical protein OLW01_13120 [Catenovulum sp. TS8]